MQFPKIPEYKFEHPFESQQKEICKKLVSFQKTLTNEQDIGLQSIGYPLFHLVEMKWVSPQITFCGFINNEPVELVQHISQVNFMLTPVEKQTTTPRRIGFSDN